MLACTTLFRIFIPTPIGEMLALASEAGVCALEFDSAARHARLDARLQRWFSPCRIDDRETPVLARTRRWLTDYFAGTSAPTIDLPLDLRGAAFEQRVWGLLQTIPPGTTTTYGALATALGAAAASRAVGAANGANPIAIVVPCHRVIGASGSLTGYGGGLDRKRWLIEHERRWRTDCLF